MSGRTVTLVIEGVEGTDIIEALSAWPVGSVSCTEGDVPAALRKRVAELEAERDGARQLAAEYGAIMMGEADCDLGRWDSEWGRRTWARLQWGESAAARLYPRHDEGPGEVTPLPSPSEDSRPAEASRAVRPRRNEP